MAMGTRKHRERQEPLWYRAELAEPPGRPFYQRLNQMLEGADFGRFCKGRCQQFYHDKLGRPSLPPGRCFRLMLIGFFEGLESEREIAWRVADSLCLRQLLGVGLDERTPDHVTISRTRRLMDEGTHREVFSWVPRQLARAGLLKGKTNRKLWVEWATKRYRSPAVIPEVRALARTARILPLIIDIAGRGSQAHSLVPGGRSANFLWETLCGPGEVGGDGFLARREAARVPNDRAVPGTCSVGEECAGCQRLRPVVTLFEGELLIIRAYQAVLEGYHQLYMSQQNRSQAAPAEAAVEMRRVASEVTRVRSETFFGDLPVTLREVADFVEAGKPPPKIVGS